MHSAENNGGTQIETNSIRTPTNFISITNSFCVDADCEWLVFGVLQKIHRFIY